MGHLIAVKADITKMSVDAIINAANNSLLGGGGVDGAIHRAAGADLLEECRKIGGCPTGEARLTGGYRLPAAYIIHTVGPVWQGGTANEAQLLQACYQNCLRLATANSLQSIAFPAISCGVYGYPVEQAVKIAVRSCSQYVNQVNQQLTIHFVCFDKIMLSHYQRLLQSDEG